MILKKVTPDKPKDFEKVDNKPWWPKFNLKPKDIPEIKEYSIGKVFRMEVEVELSSFRKGKNDMDGDIGFDVKKVGVIKKDSKADFRKMVKEGK